MRAALILTLLFGIGFAHADEKESRSPCSIALIAIGKRFPLTPGDRTLLLRGNDGATMPEDMSTNGLSYLAASDHLTGRQKAKAWDGLVRHSRTIGARGGIKSYQVPVDDTRVVVFVGGREELLVIDVRTGQCWRGTWGGEIPKDWDFETYLPVDMGGTGRLRPLGPPGRFDM